MRWLGPLISLLLMIAAVGTVWFLLTDAGDSLLEGFNSDEPVELDADDTEPVEDIQPDDPIQADVDEAAAPRSMKNFHRCSPAISTRPGYEQPRSIPKEMTARSMKRRYRDPLTATPVRSG